MALITCSECGHRMSNSAKACPSCGASKRGGTKWWLWIPLALIAAFLAYGYSIPENEAKALAAYNQCRDMYKTGHVASLHECEALEARIKAGE